MIAGTTACQEVITPIEPDNTEQEENKDNEQKPDEEQGEEEVNTGVVRSMAFVSVSPENDLNQAIIQLSSEGLTVNNGTYKGTGVFLNLVIRTEIDEEGVVTLADGTYEAAVNTAEPLTWQVTEKNGETTTGSYVAAVIKGEPTLVELTEGTVTVTKAEANDETAEEQYTIVVKSGKYDLTYVGTLEGLYTPPIEAAFTGLGGWMDYSMFGMSMIGADLYTEGCTVTSQNWQYTYTGNGYHLKLEIYCEGGVIEPGEYVAATTLEPFKFNAGSPSGGTEIFEVVNGVATSVGKITDGTIIVEKNEDTYTLTIDASNLKATYVGKLEALPEPEPEPEPEQPAVPTVAQLTTCLSATSNVANGTNSVTINLGTDGISSTTDPQTWQTVWTGEGGYLALDIYSADGTLVPGTYTACATGGQIGEGEFGIGWDPGDLWGIGMVFENWGTCWWNVSGGAATAAGKVVDGTVKVALKGDVYTITLESTLMNATYTGTLPGLTLPEVPEVANYELTTCLSATSNVANGTNSVTINLGTDGISSTTDPQTWQTVWTGEGGYLALDIYSADGTLVPGTYTACATGGQIGEGEFGIGWDPGDLWGIGMVFENWGTCWWNVSGGAATAAGKVLDGTVTVALEGEVYTITLESSLVNATYTGPLTGLTLPQEPEVEYVDLTTLLSFQSNVANGTNSLTINLATEGVSSTFDMTTYQTVWTGEGNYLGLDIYSADGTLVPGTYTACATGGQIGEGEFGIGWDPGDLWGIGMVFENWGTCWWNVSGGAATAAGKVLDGTITVELEGDVYTITLESSLVNAKYVGAIAQ